MHKSQDTGLLRLIINVIIFFQTESAFTYSYYTYSQHNNYTSESEANMRKLTDLLRQRDPILQKAAALSAAQSEQDNNSLVSGKESSLGRTNKSGRNQRMTSFKNILSFFLLFIKSNIYSFKVLYLLFCVNKTESLIKLFIYILNL